MLSETTVAELVKECEAANLFALPAKYDSRLPDLASSTLTYYQKDTSKTIFWREIADDKLLEIGKKLEGIANDTTAWEMNTDQELPAGAIPNQLLVNLRNDVEPKRFAASYSTYGMFAKEEINIRGNYWLLEYDDTKIAPYKMLQKIVKDERVLMAEFNKVVTQRD